MEQILALIRQYPFFSAVSVIGTAVSITFVMVIYMVYDIPASIELFGTEKTARHKRDIVDTPIVQIHLTNRTAHSPHGRIPTVSKIGWSQIGDKFRTRKFCKNSVDSPIRHARIGIAVVGLAVRVSIRRIYHATVGIRPCGECAVRFVRWI